MTDTSLQRTTPDPGSPTLVEPAPGDPATVEPAPVEPEMEVPALEVGKSAGLLGRAGRAGRSIGAGPLAAELRVAVMRTSRRLRAEAASTDISPGQYSVLAAIMEGPRTVGQLAAREQIQAPSMTRIVNALAASGLVGRGENPHDKRQVLVSITESGSSALLRARSKRTAWLARQVAALTSQERATLHEAALILQEMSA